MKTESIRCRDFMVGDWCCDHHGFPMQITNVGDDYAYATFEGNEGDPWEFDDKDDQPQPILLSGTVLIDNGWDAHSYTLPHNLKIYYYVKDESEYYLVWNRGILSIWLDWEKVKEEGAYANIVIPIKYVHQLQQVLRLAGLTDIANNFKI